MIESQIDHPFRMPAEWEPHQATWLSWPHNEKSWPGKIEEVWPRYAEMIAALARSETVCINVNDGEMERSAKLFLKQAGCDGEVLFYHFPTNDAWCRDHGAIFVTGSEENSLVAVDWEYNAWGEKYPPYDLDQLIPQQMAAALGISSESGGMVLEGGSIDVNGQGLLLTTESCLLNQNRNPQLSKAQVEQRLRTMLGVDAIYWLKEGIVGDDTDGHIDDIARFVDQRTILTALEADPQDENYVPLRANRERLKAFRTPAGQSFDILELPMPPAVVHQGQRLPASYANFYIANTIVLMPMFGSGRDRQAEEILQHCFPRREIVGIDCTDIIWGLGACHCLTQQVPAC